MAKSSKDLFDDNTMSFGEHLEVLRFHLIKAMIGLVICIIVSLYFGHHVIDLVRGPIDDALADFGFADEEVVDDIQDKPLWDQFKDAFGFGALKKRPVDPDVKELPMDVLRVTVSADSLSKQLNRINPKRWPIVDKDKASLPPDTENENSSDAVPDRATEESDRIVLDLKSPEFRNLRSAVEKTNKPVTLNVQEAFLTYLKVSFVAGFVLASPWVFYQTWLFVAAGLYPHERKYVYIYLPISLFLFLVGAVFCFKLVFPFVLNFLLGFNRFMSVQPQIRLSEWISFAITLPLMFGLSFQLPLVMLFLERISVFDIEGYRSKRRMAILVIAFLSMMMTPADPASMLLMMFPLIGLYELGIVMCGMRALKPSPFDEGEAAI